jgi:hypothetical protein
LVASGDMTPEAVEGWLVKIVLFSPTAPLQSSGRKLLRS